MHSDWCTLQLIKLTTLHSTLCVQGALKHRDTIQMEYEVTLEELSRKKAEKEEVRSELLCFFNEWHESQYWILFHFAS